MPRTRAQIEEAARRADAWLNSLDPSAIAAPDADASDLRELADATRVIAHEKARQAAAVDRARQNGKTWTQIAAILGISRQAARKQFDQAVAR